MAASQLTATTRSYQVEVRQPPKTNAANDTQPVSPGLAVLGRVVWMLYGPLALFLTTVGVFGSGKGFFTLADWAFLVVLGLNLAARWVEYRGGSAVTAAGEPTTRGHVLRYTGALTAGGLLVWAIAVLVRNVW